MALPASRMARAQLTSVNDNDMDREDAFMITQIACISNAACRLNPPPASDGPASFCSTSAVALMECTSGSQAWLSKNSGIFRHMSPMTRNDCHGSAASTSDGMSLITWVGVAVRSLPLWTSSCNSACDSDKQCKLCKRCSLAHEKRCIDATVSMK